MSIVGVIVIKNGITDQYTHNDNDWIEIVDMDNLSQGQCPTCGDGLRFGMCSDCGVNWNNEEDGTDVANRMLFDEGGAK